MKKIDYLAVEHAKRFAKNWDYFIVACEAYRAGSLQAPWMPFLDDEVELENLPGEQQLTPMSFETWRKQNESMPLKDALKTYLPWFDFTDLRVEEKDGKISFQGVAKRENN